MIEYGYSGPERRRFKRIRRKFFTRIAIRQEQAVTDIPAKDIVMLQNLSADGALFTYDKEIAPETFLTMNINFPLIKSPIVCVGKVVRIEEPRTQPTYRIATCFTEISDVDRDFIAKAADEFYTRKAGAIEA